MADYREIAGVIANRSVSRHGSGMTTSTSQQSTAMEDFFSPETLAEYLGIPVGTIYSWRYKGTGPRAMKVGKHLRYSKSSVEAWLQQQEL